MTNLWRHPPVIAQSHNAASVVNNGLAEMQEYPANAMGADGRTEDVAHVSKKDATERGGLAVSIFRGALPATGRKLPRRGRIQMKSNHFSCVRPCPRLDPGIFAAIHVMPPPYPPPASAGPLHVARRLCSLSPLAIRAFYARLRRAMERVGVRGRFHTLRLAETPPHPEFARRARKFRISIARRRRA